MRATIVVVVMLMPTLAFAQLPTAGEAMRSTETNTKTAKVQTIDFGEGDVVQGEIIKPLGDDVGGETRRNPSSLINVRANFVAELVKSIEEI